MKLRENKIGNKEFDTADSRNVGVVADELCGTSPHVAARRITYREPETGREFVFITNETQMDARRKTIREYVQLMAELGKPPNPLLAKPLKPPQFCLQFLRVLKDGCSSRLPGRSF